jgi:hypothetical protein
MTDFNPVPKRIAREMTTNNYSLSVEARNLLVELGDVYNATASATLDELILRLAPGIIKAKRKSK